MQSRGCGRARHGGQGIDLVLQPAFSAAPAASACAVRHVRVSLVLDVAVESDASLFRGDASESARERRLPRAHHETCGGERTRAAPPPRASRHVWRRANESGAATICARTAALQVCNRLSDRAFVAVQSHVLLRLGVASERVESKASPTPSSRTMEPVGRRGVLGCQMALGP